MWYSDADDVQISTALSKLQETSPENFRVRAVYTVMIIAIILIITHVSNYPSIHPSIRLAIILGTLLFTFRNSSRAVYTAGVSPSGPKKESGYRRTDGTDRDPLIESLRRGSTRASRSLILRYLCLDYAAAQIANQ